MSSVWQETIRCSGRGGTITGTLDPGAGTDTLDLIAPDWAQNLTYEGSPASGTLTYSDSGTTETFDWTDFEAVNLTGNALENTITLEAGSYIDNVYGLVGQDSILNSGTVNTIYAGDDNDTVTNSGSVVNNISGGGGSDASITAGRWALTCWRSG